MLLQKVTSLMITPIATCLTVGLPSPPRQNKLCLTILFFHFFNTAPILNKMDRMSQDRGDMSGWEVWTVLWEQSYRH